MTSPVREVELNPTGFDMLFHLTADDRQMAVPGPARLAGVTVPAGTIQNLRDLCRRVGQIFEACIRFRRNIARIFHRTVLRGDKPYAGGDNAREDKQEPGSHWCLRRPLPG